VADSNSFFNTLGGINHNSIVQHFMEAQTLWNISASGKWFQGPHSKKMREEINELDVWLGEEEA
jgi:hypothetical protein